MASEDLVFVENVPSMQLISGPSVEITDGPKNTQSEELPYSHLPATPSASGPSLGCNPCGLAFRSKPDHVSYPPVPKKSGDLQHCCHGSCQRDDNTPNKMGAMKPNEVPNIPPPPMPPVYPASASWMPPGSRRQTKPNQAYLPSSTSNNVSDAHE